MMPDPLRELAELEAAATPGPWRWTGMLMAEGSEQTYAGYPQRITGRNPDPTDTSPVLVAECFDGNPDEPPPNAALIVWLRNNAPALIASQAAEIGELGGVARANAIDLDIANGTLAAILELAQSWVDRGPSYATCGRMIARLATHREADTDQGDSK